MPRLFIALRPPDWICEQIGGLCQGLPGARWTADEDIHLTLRFIGEADHRTFCEIGEDLLGITMPPFEMALQGLGHFPVRDAVRQIWVGVEKSEALLRLKRRIDRIVGNSGIAAERRKFLPHVTIARFSVPPPQDRLASYLSARARFSTRQFPVNSFQLISSHLTRNRAHYVVEAEYDFVRSTIERG